MADCSLVSKPVSKLWDSVVANAYDCAMGSNADTASDKLALRLETKTLHILLRILDQEAVESTLAPQPCTQKAQDRQNSPVPPKRREHCHQMPQAMRIDRTPPRREIKQLQAHGKDNPCDNHTRPSRPRSLRLLVSADTEPAPDDVLNNANDYVRGHVISIVETPEGEIRDMGQVKRDTQ